MNIDRRSFVTGLSLVIAASSAGCTGLVPVLDDDDECEGESVLEESGHFTAGDFAESTVSIEAEQILSYTVSRVGGNADPTVRIENPDGDTVHERQPDREVSGELEADMTGEYLLVLENNTEDNGDWEIVVEILPAGC